MGDIIKKLLIDKDYSVSTVLHIIWFYILESNIIKSIVILITVFLLSSLIEWRDKKVEYIARFIVFTIILLLNLYIKQS